MDQYLSNSKEKYLFINWVEVSLCDNFLSSFGGVNGNHFMVLDCCCPFLKETQGGNFCFKESVDTG